MNIPQADYPSNEDNPTLSPGMNIPNNPAVDLDVLRDLEQAQTAGEPDLIVELIDLYLEGTPQQLTSMSTFLVQADALALRRAAHSLKGSSATMGAGHTAALCETIEMLVEDDLLDAVAGALRELEQEFAEVRRAFMEERQRRSS